MIKHPRLRFALSIATLILALPACSLPSTTPPTATSIPRTPTPTPTSTPAYSPTPDLPSGWVTYRSEALAISLYHPAEWEVVPYGAHKVDLQEKEGQGWVEITILDASTMDRWSLDYRPGMSAEVIIGELVRAAQENGTFDAPQPIENRSGLSAWAARGHYDVLDENLLIAAISGSDRGVILTGHGGPDDALQHGLAPIYEQIVWSITY